MQTDTLIHREIYKQYFIDLRCDPDRSWEATITRRDGRLIKIDNQDWPPTYARALTGTTSDKRDSLRNALDEAKAMIDGGGMDRNQ